ncbi:tryptophan synthase subunit alpha [Nitrosomonas sp. sh817]|jgi:tryptophan synthase alpha chain|uniref:tryptophan synthase subunit alpha n=1 Tax=unclassified Nitrosomonas TaxID=2609265 RepID=UPI0027DDB51D|nr:tryptophan synthase subunit alpha [Nitrosomonas sp. sh817]WMJ07462.1 tryptophan synthase subunit alpha [Nitrosomonas sp. sh817]
MSFINSLLNYFNGSSDTEKSNRIAQTFNTLKRQNRKALIPFVTAGDPNPQVTVPLMHQLVHSGADIIELGIPFSDPMADGPTIQRSSERALKHHVSLNDVLSMVSEFRQTNSDTPVVLMGYANPVEAMGYEFFAARAKQCGVDGILIVDYPPEESEKWVECLDQQGIDAIFLLSPTTPQQRIEQVAKMARGYVYYVSLKGVTGASHLDLQDVSNMLTTLRQYISLPIGVGFGIRDGATAKAVAGLADAVVVGSRIIEEIEKSTEAEILDKVGHLLNTLRKAIDEN